MRSAVYCKLYLFVYILGSWNIKYRWVLIWWNCNVKINSGFWNVDYNWSVWLYVSSCIECCSYIIYMFVVWMWKYGNSVWNINCIIFAVDSECYASSIYSSSVFICNFCSNINRIVVIFACSQCNCGIHFIEYCKCLYGEYKWTCIKPVILLPRIWDIWPLFAENIICHISLFYAVNAEHIPVQAGHVEYDFKLVICIKRNDLIEINCIVTRSWGWLLCMNQLVIYINVQHIFSVLQEICWNCSKIFILWRCEDIFYWSAVIKWKFSGRSCKVILVILIETYSVIEDECKYPVEIHIFIWEIEKFIVKWIAVIGYVEISPITCTSTPCVFANPCSITRWCNTEIILWVIVIPSYKGYCMVC